MVTGARGQHDRAKATWKGALKVESKEGKAELGQYAIWPEREWSTRWACWRESLDEMFTINGLSLPGELCRCPSATNMIDNGRSALRDRSGRTKHCQNGTAAPRWPAEAMEGISQWLRGIMRYTVLDPLAMA